MNLCVFCLAELFPRRWQDTGSARRGSEVLPSTLNVKNVTELLDDGWTMYSADGRPLPMYAVSQFRGTLVCAQHAADAVHHLEENRDWRRL